MMNTTQTQTAVSLEEMLCTLRTLEERIGKGAEVLGSPAHAGKDDETTLKYESAWIDLSRQHARLYDQLLSDWKNSGVPIEWEFPAAAEVALPPGWVRETDGTLTAWMTYTEFRKGVIAVTDADTLPLEIVPPEPQSPTPAPATMERLL